MLRRLLITSRSPPPSVGAFRLGGEPLRGSGTCRISYDLNLRPLSVEEAEKARETIQKLDVLEDSGVEFRLTEPRYWWEWLDTTSMFMNASLWILMPHVSLAADFEQICDWLKLRGIQVEHTESGARLGLTEFALMHVQDGVKKHLENRCDCNGLYGNGNVDSKTED